MVVGVAVIVLKESLKCPSPTLRKFIPTRNSIFLEDGEPPPRWHSRCVAGRGRSGRWPSRPSGRSVGWLLWGAGVDGKLLPWVVGKVVIDRDRLGGLDLLQVGDVVRPGVDDDPGQGRRRRAVRARHQDGAQDVQTRRNDDPVGERFGVLDERGERLLLDGRAVGNGPEREAEVSTDGGAAGANRRRGHRNRGRRRPEGRGRERLGRLGRLRLGLTRRGGRFVGPCEERGVCSLVIKILNPESLPPPRPGKCMRLERGKAVPRHNQLMRARPEDEWHTRFQRGHGLAVEREDGAFRHGRRVDVDPARPGRRPGGDDDRRRRQGRPPPSRRPEGSPSRPPGVWVHASGVRGETRVGVGPPGGWAGVCTRVGATGGRATGTVPRGEAWRPCEWVPGPPRSAPTNLDRPPANRRRRKRGGGPCRKGRRAACRAPSRGRPSARRGTPGTWNTTDIRAGPDRSEPAGRPGPVRRRRSPARARRRRTPRSSGNGVRGPCSGHAATAARDGPGYPRLDQAEGRRPLGRVHDHAGGGRSRFLERPGRPASIW